MNKAVKSVVMVLGIGAFLQVFGVASATWTGAENGFWTNANNWVDGQIAGRWLVKDAGGNLVTNGVKGSTAYFGAEGAAGATTIDFDGVVSVSNILVTGGSAAPRYTFGTAITQNIPMEAYGTFSAAETEGTPVAVIGGKFYGPLESTGRVYGGDWITYRNNNTSETLVLERWGGAQIWAGPKTDVDKHYTEPRVVFDGAGDIRLDADTQNSGNHQYTLRTSGKLIINCDFKKVRGFQIQGDCSHTVEILAGKSFRHATGYYDFLNPGSGNPTTFIGEGVFCFGGGYHSGNKEWKNSQNYVNSDLTFLCPVTSLRTTTGYTDADWMPGLTVHQGGGTLTFAGETSITGTVALISSSAGLKACYNSFGTRSGLWQDDFWADNNATIRYIGAGETTDRSICVTNTASSRPHMVALEQAGTGAFVANSAITKAANVTAPTFILRNDTDQAATFGGTLGDDFKLTKDGAGVWTIGSVLTHTGVTTIQAGTLALAPSGSLENSSGISFGTDASLVLLGDAGNAVSRTLPPLSIAGAGASLHVRAGVAATLSALPATAVGTLDIVTEDATATVRLAGAAGGIAPAWVTLNGQPAEFDENGQLRKRTVPVDTNIPAYGGVIPDDSTKAVGVTSVGTEGDGPITLAANATAVATLAQKTSVEAVVDLAAGQTLTAGQLAVAEGAAPLTIGSAEGQGTLAAASGTFTLYPDAGGEITVKATPSLGAATQIAKIGDGSVRFATNFSYGGAVQIGGGELAVTPSGTSQTFSLAGGGSFAKEGDGAWTVPAGKNADFGGDYIVRGGIVTPGATSVSTIFGQPDNGDLVITNGAALHTHGSLTKAVNFGNKRVRVSGDGPDGRGAIVHDAPASAGANGSFTFPLLTLEGDTSMNMTNIASTTCYIGRTADDPGVFDMQGHDFTRRGSSRLALTYCTVTNGGAIHLVGPDNYTGTLDYYGFLVFREGLTFAGTPPTIYAGKDVCVMTSNCGLVPCPIVVEDGASAVFGTYASNLDTNYNCYTGPVRLTGESSNLHLHNYGAGDRLITFAGEISGLGSVSNTPGGGKYYFAAPTNTYTGETRFRFAGGSGSWGTATFERSTSIPDFSKCTFSHYGTVNVRMTHDQSLWTHAEVGRLMREATFSNIAMVGIDTTYTGDYTIDISSLGAAPTGTSGLAANSLVPNDNVVTLNLDADYLAYSTYVGASSGTLRIRGTGGVLGVFLIQIQSERVAGLESAVEITDGAEVRVSNSTGGSIAGLYDASWSVLRVRDGGYVRPKNDGDTSSVNVGTTTSSRGIVEIGEGGRTLLGYNLGTGGNTRGGALYVHEGGTATVNRVSYVGHTAAGYADIDGGMIDCIGDGYLRFGSANARDYYGIVHQSGGTIKHEGGSPLTGSKFGTHAFYRMTGGETILDTTGDIAFAWPFNGRDGFDSTAVLTLDGADALFQVAAGKYVYLANQTNGVAIVNLNAGVFEMGRYRANYSAYPGSAAYVNFNGGTLRANADNSDFLNGTTRVLIDAGGATIDTAGHDVTVNEPFAAPTGNGVASIALPDNLATTKANLPWAVRIAGDGTGATAIVEYEKSLKRMTGVRITSPGCGYTTAKAIFWAGQTGATISTRPDKPITNECVLAANAAPGVFTKKGEGTLTFGAGGGLPAGVTVDVQEGTLDLNGTSAGIASISSSGNGTVVNGSSAVTLPSALAIDVPVAQAGHYLTVGGDAVLPATLTLLNVDQVDARAKSFTILKVTGAVTGALPAIDPATPTPPAWQLYWNGPELKLGVPRATHIYFR